jgi:hypothetical protein
MKKREADIFVFTLKSNAKGGFRARMSEFNIGEGEQKTASNAEINSSAMNFS